MSKDAAITKRSLKKAPKTELKQELINKLSDALGDYKAKMGEKKFTSKIKKASKLFAVDLRRALRKNEKAAKKTKVEKRK
jgi:hypothetical protein